MFKILWGILGWKGTVAFILAFCAALLGAYKYGEVVGLRGGAIECSRVLRVNAEAMAEAMAEELRKQAEAFPEQEEKVVEKIIYRDRVVTQFKEIVRENPSDVSCNAPPERMSIWNDIILQSKSPL